MADPITRLHYFDHQFLREKDFTDEQKYHTEMRRLHNQLLHTSGIAEGLEIPRPKKGDTKVTINKGTAYDSQGREIVLTESRPLDLLRWPPGAPVFVKIAYSEVETHPTSETGMTGNTRYTEDPLIEDSLDDSTDYGKKLVLARVIRDGTTITGIDDSMRLKAGSVVGDIVAHSLKLKNDDVTSANWPSLRGDDRRVDVGGSLFISGDIKFDGKLTGALGPNMVGTDQLSDNSVSFEKLSLLKVFESSSTATAGETLPLTVYTFPVSIPVIPPFVVHAYSMRHGGSIEWKESSKTIRVESGLNVEKSVSFTNTSSFAIDIEIKIYIPAIEQFTVSDRLKIFAIYDKAGKITSVSKVELMLEGLEHPYGALEDGEAVLEVPAENEILQLEALQIHEQFKVNVAKKKLVKKT
jgi:hypothetical protein